MEWNVKSKFIDPAHTRKGMPRKNELNLLEMESITLSLALSGISLCHNRARNLSYATEIHTECKYDKIIQKKEKKAYF